MSSRFSDDYHIRKGTRTTKSSAYDTEHERRQSHNISKKLERNRSRSRSRSRSSPSSSASSSSSPSPDRHYGSTHQSECRSKNEHKLSKHDSNYLAADKNVNDCESRNDSCSTSTGSSSNIKQNGNNRIALGQSNRYRHDSDGSNNVVCPPPPIISKVSMSFSKPVGPAKPVQMKLSTAKPSDTVKKLTVAKAFSTNDSSDDEVEEMPAECRMRMRNIGRDTPTSSGPNSFGKTKQGFCDAKKIFEKNLRECSYD